jgi:hypothetical protein
MRPSAMTFVLLLSAVAFGQTPQGMNEQDMQKLQHRSAQVEVEIKSLCAEGKRDEAQQQAISFGRDMVQAPTMQAMRTCGEMLKNLMPMLPLLGQDSATPTQHVCDAR